MALMLSGRTNVTFESFRWHLRPVPMILYRGKVPSERPIDDVTKGDRYRWNDLKVPMMSRERRRSRACCPKSYALASALIF